MENNDIMTWSVAIVAVSFVILCGFLISLLKTAQQSMLTAQSAMQEVKETVENLGEEVKRLAESVNEVADDISGKLQSTDPLFEAVQDVGILLSEITGTARKVTQNIGHSVRQQATATEENNATPAWLEWAVIGSRVVKSIQKGWKQQKEQTHSDKKGEV